MTQAGLSKAEPGALNGIGNGARDPGPDSAPGVVFFLGQGFLEVSGHADGPAGPGIDLDPAPGPPPR
jgi:hypothetical protein